MGHGEIRIFVLTGQDGDEGVLGFVWLDFCSSWVGDVEEYKGLVLYLFWLVDEYILTAIFYEVYFRAWASGRG